LAFKFFTNVCECPEVAEDQQDPPLISAHEIDFVKVQSRFPLIISEAMDMLFHNKTSLNFMLVQSILNLLVTLISRSVNKKRWIELEDARFLDGIEVIEKSTLVNDPTIETLLKKLKNMLRLHNKHAFSDLLDEVSSDVDVPKEYVCPITLKLMEDPVILEDGHSYDRKAIERWLRTNRRSPTTNEILNSKHMISNYSLKSLIEAFVEKQQDQLLQIYSHAPLAKRVKL
jgi:hypothetical protein